MLSLLYIVGLDLKFCLESFCVCSQRILAYSFLSFECLCLVSVSIMLTSKNKLENIALFFNFLEKFVQICSYFFFKYLVEFPSKTSGTVIFFVGTFFGFCFFVFLFLAVLGLRFCVRAFSSCGEWGPLFIAVRGPLTVAVAMRRLSSCGSRAQLLRGMWDLPRPGLEPMSPALAGRFLTTAPPGKPLWERFLRSLLSSKGFVHFISVVKFISLKLFKTFPYFFNIYRICSDTICLISGISNLFLFSFLADQSAQRFISFIDLVKNQLSLIFLIFLFCCCFYFLLH